MDWFNDDAKKRVKAAVAAAEAKTSAEIVVSVHRSSGAYLHVDLAAGAVAALGLLAYFLYADTEFDWTYFPLEQVAVFAVAAALVHAIDPIRRRLIRAKVRRAAVARAARSSFVEQGISRTSGRTGILIYVSIFEGFVHVVPDIGIDPKRLGDRWTTTLGHLDHAARGEDLRAFFHEIENLGALLGEHYPHRDDDVNELPDDLDGGGDDEDDQDGEVSS